MNFTKKIFSFVFVYIFLFSCVSKKKSSSDIFEVPYTYWQSSSGPFPDLCGGYFSMIFTGTVKFIDVPDPSVHNLYLSKKGQISIENILFSRKTEKRSYLNQKFFQSDCFSSFKGKVNDKVIVFLDEYEGNYSIAGDKSIITISSFDDNLVGIIKKYIKNFDPDDIKNEILTLKKYGLDSDFKRILQCRQSR